MLESRRMRNINLFALLFWMALFWISACSDSASSDRLEYSVRSVLSDSERHLVVDLAFRGDPSGQTRVFLPDLWAGQEELYKSISNLSCLSEDMVLEETDRPHVRSVRHEPGETVKIRYSVKQQWTGQIEGRRFQKYWPIIGGRSFHFVGLVLFVYPDRFRSGEVDFSIKWRDFPRDWQIGNSFGCNKRRQRFTTSLENFRRSVYLGGDYRIRKIDISGRPVYVAVGGHEWNFSDSAFVRFIDRLVSTERNFWNDHKFPYFLIALNPFGRGHRNSGGTALFQSFDVFFPSHAELNVEFKRLFAHELFHTWNTAKLGRRPQPEQLLYWFSEGFTDYYARLLLLRAGLITLEEYVSDFNKQLNEYHQSPVREAPNQRILEGYWSDEHLGRLPYLRGDIIAHRWNSLIRSKTQGQSSLDDILLALFARSQAEGLVLSHEVLIEEMKRFLGEEIEEELKMYIEGGRLIELTGEELGPCYELFYKQLQREETEDGLSFLPQFTHAAGATAVSPEKCLDWFAGNNEN